MPRRRSARAREAGVCSCAEPDTFPDRCDLRDACPRISKGLDRDAPTCSAPKSDRAALALPGGPVVRCVGRSPVCGQAMTGRETSVYADKSLAAKSRRALAVQELAERLALSGDTLQEWLTAPER